MSMNWRLIWDAVQSSLPPPTADGPGVIPSSPLARVCCFSLNALPRINTHRITNVINSQRDLTTAEKGQRREASTKKATKRVDGHGDLTAAGRKGNKIGGEKGRREITDKVRK